MEKVFSVILIIGIIILAVKSLYQRFIQPLVPLRKEKDVETYDIDEHENNYAERFYKYFGFGVYLLIVLGIVWACHGDEISDTWKGVFRWDDRYDWMYVYGIISICIIIILLSINWRNRKMNVGIIKEPHTTEDADMMIDKQEGEVSKSSEEITEQKNEPNMEQIEIKIPDSTTRTSLMVALRKQNLQYEFDEDNNFLVTYQGENFRIIAENDSVFVQIQDCWWYGASLADIDNLALLHRAVNECNIHDLNRMVYTYNDSEKEIGIHTLRDILWMPQIPDSDLYLMAAFNSMLRSHQLFFRMMEELRRKEFARRNY